jgi:hypothetical protein
MIMLETLLYRKILMLKAFQCVQVLAARHSNHRVQIMATTSRCTALQMRWALYRCACVAGTMSAKANLNMHRLKRSDYVAPGTPALCIPTT